MMQQSGVPAPGRVQEIIDQVLAQPEFQYASTSPVVRWIRAALDLIGRVVRRWLPALGDTQIQLLSWLLVAVTVAVGGYVATRWKLGHRTPMRPQAGNVSTQAVPLDSVG